MVTAGIDVGSATTKTVILDGSANQIITSNIMTTGAFARKTAQNSIDKAIEDAGLRFEDIQCIIGTGYGRFNVPFVSKQVTEITCHAKGAKALFPETRTVIDIGGQDSKAIRVNEKGEATDFVMNDKCAAGTGRFLEVISRVLEIDIDKLGKLSLNAKNKIEISSMCTVFAESEVISLIASGSLPEDIADGIHRAIVDRIISLASKINIIGSITLTGGVIKNIGVVQSIKNRLNENINIPENPQTIGALGASLIAKNNISV